MSSLKMDISGLNSGELVLKAKNLVEDMTGNANFATPEPALADITAKVEELENWISKASFGDKRAVEYRDSVKAELVVMLRSLAGYVSSIAKGDGNVILSSGFEVRKEKTPPQPLARPVDFNIKRTDYEGTVTLDWSPVKDCHSYRLEVSTQNPETENANWTPLAVTTKSRYDTSNMVFGVYYYYRVKAIGAAGESPWSEIAFIRAS